MALTIGGVPLAVGGLAAVTDISCLVVDKCVYGESFYVGV